MERLIESFILGTRWLLLPLYLALLVSVCGIYVMVGRELVHVVATLPQVTESEFILAVLAVLDLVLIANLLLLVGVSSYESYISRIEAEGLANKPEWLGKLDSGNVKVKVALSIVMISAIHLRRAFMNEQATDRLMVLAGVHLVFVASALLLAYVDRIGRTGPGAH
jgi:uncharacterized protein (TIGR00645 family)